MENVLKMDSLFLPSYVEKYQCQMCGGCCLSKWRIDVDELSKKAIEKQYAEIGREEKIEGIFASNTGNSYKVNFDEKGKCKFLAEDGRCSMQLEIGHEYLTDVCKTYPRQIFVSPRGIEISLSFSCPTAARLLLEKEPVTFRQLDVKNNTFFFMKPKKTRYYIPSKLGKKDIRNNYFVIEAGLIRVLQNRQYSISERILLLGNILGKLAALNGKEASLQEIEKILNSYEKEVSVKKNYEMYLHSIRQIISPLLKEKAEVNSSLGYLIKAILLASGLKKGESLDLLKAKPENIVILASAYEETLQKYYVNKDGEFEYILENFFVNYIFRKAFYFENWQKAFFNMALQYALIKFYAVGFCAAYNKPVEEQFLLDAIIETENHIGHSEGYLRTIWEYLTNNMSTVELHEIVFNLARG